MIARLEVKSNRRYHQVVVAVVVVAPVAFHQSIRNAGAADLLTFVLPPSLLTV